MFLSPLCCTLYLVAGTGPAYLGGSTMTISIGERVACVGDVTGTVAAPFTGEVVGRSWFFDRVQSYSVRRDGVAAWDGAEVIVPADMLRRE